ncbi:MAG: alkaline phosphatase D family protein [Opitutales bacterium]
MDRRRFIWNSTLGVVSLGSVSHLPAIVTPSQARPLVTHGVLSGDVEFSKAVIWARSNRPSRMRVDLFADSEHKIKIGQFHGTAAMGDNDYCSKAFLHGLPEGAVVYYKVRFQSFDDLSIWSEPTEGQFATPKNDHSDVSFCWSGDTAGQGWGIDENRGGMRAYASMAALKPDFFVHSGDLIYADGPMKSEVTLDDGTLWKNTLIEAKTRVAESTQDFRDNFKYNLMDKHVRDFHATVPVYNQWDDHEVTNNWYPGEILEDDRYTERRVSVLAERARRAFFECNPIAPHLADPERIYRKISRGPLLDLFFIDLRSYRGVNTSNRQEEPGPDTAFLGEDQLQWLKRELKKSKATWKMICSDMPIGIVVAEWGQDLYENGANRDDASPKGREMELARLFQFIARESIHNVHFITADVHYCCSNYYNPEKAGFKDFKPFWEFVSGPLHAGTFGPNDMDGTFGPELKFKGIPDDLAPNRSPADPYQFFGHIKIDGETQAMTVAHYNASGDRLWDTTLEAEQA